MKNGQRKLGLYPYKRWYSLAISLVVLMCAGFFMSAPYASALTTVPTKMNFQGRLTDSAGNIKPNGTYNMKLKLYTVSTGGSSVWSEDRLVSATQGVAVTNGLFSIQIGSITSLPANLFASGALYLEVELPTPATATTSSPVWTEGAMTPRNQMATSAYAYNSETLDGLDSTQFARLDASNTFTTSQLFNLPLSGEFAVSDGTSGLLSITRGSGGVTDIDLFFNNMLDIRNDTSDVVLQMYDDQFLGTGMGQVKFYTEGTFRVEGQFGDLFNINATSRAVSIGAVDSTAAVLILDTKNTTGDPTGVAGATYYNSFSGKFRCYENGTWKDCMGINNGTSQQTGANFNIDGTGTADTFRASLFDTASATALTIGSTATSISLAKDTTIAAGKSVTIVGGTTGTRPASPTEGMIYYDTTTKQLLTYANGKWQADRTTATKIVATSASGGASGAAASLNYDAADYVNASTTSAQTVINDALDDLTAGGTVYLMEGTYIVDGSINIPNNVTLTGAGKGTIIKVKNSHNADINAITNTDQTTGTNITVSNLSLDGNSANNSSGNQYGVVAVALGNVAGSRPGIRIAGVTAQTFRSYSFALNGSAHSTISNNTNVGGGGGVWLTGGSQAVSITGNNFGGGNYGVVLSSGGNVVSGNTFQFQVLAGVYVSAASNIVTGNSIVSSGGTTNNNAIYLTAADSNQVTNNFITDISCTTTCYAINVVDATSDTNYIAGNTLGNGSINDAGTGTVYGGQVNGSGNFLIQPAGTIELLKNTNVTGILTASSKVLTPTVDTATAVALNIGTTTATAINIGNTTSNILTTINGRVLVKPTTGNDSTTAFQVQNAAGASILGADSVNANITTSLGNLTVAGLTSPASLTLTGSTTGGSLPTGATYTYKVASFYGSSTSVAGTPTPSSYVTSTATSKVTLNWTAQTGAGGYYVYRQKNGAGSWFRVTVTGGGSTSYIDTTDASWSGTNYASTATATTAQAGNIYLNQGSAIHLDGNGSGGAFLWEDSSNGLTFGNYNAGGYYQVQSDAFIFQNTTDYSTNFRLDNNGTATFKNRSDSASAFSVQNSVGTSVFVADTSNSRVYIGSTSADSTGVVLVLDTKDTAGDPTGVNGAMYYNSSSRSFRCYQDGAWRACIGGLVASNVGTSSVTNDAAGDKMFTSSYVIPADNCVPGRVYRITARGTYSAPVVGQPNVTMKVKIGGAGGSTLVSSSAVATTASASNRQWMVNSDIICQTVGSSGTVEAAGSYWQASSAGNLNTNEMVNAGTSAFDTTVAQTLQLGIQYSTTGSNTPFVLRQFTVEAMGP